MHDANVHFLIADQLSNPRFDCIFYDERGVSRALTELRNTARQLRCRDRRQRCKANHPMTGVSEVPGIG